MKKWEKAEIIDLSIMQTESMEWPGAGNSWGNNGNGVGHGKPNSRPNHGPGQELPGVGDTTPPAVVPVPDLGVGSTEDMS